MGNPGWAVTGCWWAHGWALGQARLAGRSATRARQEPSHPKLELQPRPNQLNLSSPLSRFSSTRPPTHHSQPTHSALMSTNTRDEEASVHVELEANSPAREDHDSATRSDEAEILAMKARVAEMEQEAAKLREMTERAESEAAGQSGADATMTDDDKEAVDGRSVYVGNVSFNMATPLKIESHSSGHHSGHVQAAVSLGSTGRDPHATRRTHIPQIPKLHTKLTQVVLMGMAEYRRLTTLLRRRRSRDTLPRAEPSTASRSSSTSSQARKGKPYYPARSAHPVALSPSQLSKTTVPHAFLTRACVPKPADTPTSSSPSRRWWRTPFSSTRQCSADGSSR